MAEDDAYITELYRDLDEHGEVHAIVEEHDREIELRPGQTEFYWQRECVTVEGPDTTHVFSFDSFVRHYKVWEVFH